jgi:predicted oxidoreductase
MSEGAYMKKMTISNGLLQIPEIGLGLMRIPRLDITDAQKLIRTALDNGISFFDHADIYANGESESYFARAVGLLGIPREQCILQSKCGIRHGCYDFSREHILKSVDGSLSRLKTDYLDILLLHRPDTLMEPEEVAEAFRILKEAGKVRHFGVSNQNAGQIALLQKYLPDPILFNQLQLSITECGMIDAGFNVNMSNEPGVNRDGGILEYCRLQGITIQAWSPLQFGFMKGPFVDNPMFPELNKKLEELASVYHVGKSAVATAWILRHPANIQVIVGTTSMTRLEEIAQASNIRLSHEEWYALYLSAGKKLP